MGRRGVPSKRVEIREIPSYFLARRRYVATKEEIAALATVNENGLRSGLSRLKTQKRLFSPARGLYVFVPPEYRLWGAVPADWYVDQMMAYMRRRYYVGLLTAAELHGAGPTSQQAFQVIVSSGIADRDLGQVSLRFFSSALLAEMPVEERKTRTGTMRVATREVTVADLVDRPRQAGGLHAVAEVLARFGALDAGVLVRVSALRHRSHARRLGLLLERFSPTTDTTLLRELASPDDGAPSNLDSGGSNHGDIDARWGVRVNTALR